ncbi:MAG: signal recognition particle protein [Nitrospirae bacterium CG_4_10_14_3_um_filter_53_41]|nr:MAG: signal recognition particle protein [Nitrospirae bacterium CG17_big_fil_post_rev_8_21_14_2_50_50_9]PIX86986.1 MAG: signal recognition particle protein [Nitrospirae bacterium CG_4_10_14_3_um_filter_53_41]
MVDLGHCYYPHYYPIIILTDKRKKNNINIFNSYRNPVWFIEINRKKQDLRVGVGVCSVFDTLTDKLNSIFRNITGKGRLSAENIQQALNDVKMALLEADVNYKVVRDLLERIQERSLNIEVHQRLNPGQQFIQIVQQELTAMMGSKESGMKLSSRPPTVVMVAGLQGSGKTTTIGKLARMYKNKGHRPLMAAADVQRPAAILQLQVLGEQLGIPVHSSESQDPVAICKEAKKRAESQGFDILFLDTAGRLHIDEALMEELDRIKQETAPDEILFVADAMTGQDAVHTSQRFNERLDITGVILTKLDGDARGGAALSINYVTRKPIKFVGTGEKLEQIEVFHPERMVSRILGMGDLLTLVEKAQESYDEEQAGKLEQKIRKQQFTLNDFLDQLKKIRKMGSLEQLIKLIPGFGRIKELNSAKPDEKELTRIEAIIGSMTPDERGSYQMINGSRRKRIARGSGTTVQEINRLLQQFAKMQKMFRLFGNGGTPAMPSGYPGMGQGNPLDMMGGGRFRNKLKKKRKIKR